MATKNFIPEIWTASILEQLSFGTVLGSLANRQYEGDATAGNTIHIPGIEPVKIKDYKGAGRKTTADDISDTDTVLKIDQEKSFDFLVDDVDRRQSKYSFEPYTKSAALGLVEDVETFLATTLLGGDTAPITAAAPTSFKEAWNIVLDIDEALTAAKVARTNRYLVVNAKFQRALLEENGKLVAVDASGNSDGLREATIGRLAGFTVLSCPYLDNSKAIAIGFTPSTLAYVSQLQEMEAMRAQDSFKDRIRGLHVYGGKVVRPEMVKAFKAN